MTNPVDKILGVIGCVVEVDIFSKTDASEYKKLSKKVHLLSVVVRKEANRIPWARMTFLEEKEGQKLSDQELLKPGNPIKILAGSTIKKEQIFSGVLIKKSLKIKESRSSILTIDCKDEAVKMTVGENSRYFYDATDSEILEEIIEKYPGLEKEVEATTVKHLEMIQYHATDWDFMLARAEANGRLLLVDDGKLSVKVPLLQTAGLKAAITNGRNVYDFSTQMDARTQYEKIVAAAWSPAEQAWIEEEGSASGLEDQGNIKSRSLSDVLKIKKLSLKHSGEVEQTELKALADAKALKSKLARLIGNAKVEYSPSIKPGDTIELKKFGDRFDGNIYVTAVQHEISKGNGFTHIQFGLAEDWSSKRNGKPGSHTGGLLPSAQGLHIAVVTQLQKDPKLHYRVKIRLPLIDPNSEGQWARMAFSDAGDNRGLFFLPEIGDEVVVGFIDEDPRHPVILGMLYSKAKKAPFDPEDANFHKGLVTKSGLQILFNDEKKQLLIATPNGNKIHLDEEKAGLSLTDQHNNSLTMDSQGITIESSGNILLKAKKDIEIEGFNLTNKAQGKYKAQGNTGAELSTNAINTIKGSLVKIN